MEFLDSGRMGAEVHLWRVGDHDKLIEIGPKPLDLESRLQEWLERDISILDPGLLVIGRQVETDFGGLIDILCIDAEGELVIVELKRDKSNQGLREVFEYLASRPDEEVTFDQVADGIGAEYGKRTVLGRLGGFGKVVEKRYGQKHFPWYYREENGRGRMEMPAAAAEVIRDVSSS